MSYPDIEGISTPSDSNIASDFGAVRAAVLEHLRLGRVARRSKEHRELATLLRNSCAAAAAHERSLLEETPAQTPAGRAHLERKLLVAREDHTSNGLLLAALNERCASTCLLVTSRKHERAANVLIVDDDFDLVDCISDILEAEGYRVHTAHTGEEGLSVLRSASLPDVVLLDVDMPLLGGPGMAHKMLLHDAGEERIPIVLFSARSDLPALASEMGTPYSIAKPFNVDALLSLLRLAISEQRSPASA
jgi:CheY-like chemotaxis protein